MVLPSIPIPIPTPTPTPTGASRTEDPTERRSKYGGRGPSRKGSFRATLIFVDPASIREFARRNRAEVQASKQRYWVQQYRALGPVRTIRASQALWQFVRRLRPDWPTQRDRAGDLAHHVELKRKIDRAAHVVAAR